MTRTRMAAAAALALTGVLALAGCAGSAPAAVESETAAPESVTVTDNHGEQTVALPPQRVVATDNRLFETLHAWGVALAAAPRRYEANYYVPHLAHASMEPPADTAQIKDGRCTVWAPSQAPQAARDLRALAEALADHATTRAAADAGTLAGDFD